MALTSWDEIAGKGGHELGVGTPACGPWLWRGARRAAGGTGQKAKERQQIPYMVLAAVAQEGGSPGLAGRPEAESPSGRGASASPLCSALIAQETAAAAGGANVLRQKEALKLYKPFLVVGTPGRIAELSRDGALQVRCAAPAPV